MLLAGALKRSIQQYCEVKRDAYNILLVPCGCCDDVDMGEPISIMWTTANPSETTPPASTNMNHIVALLPNRGNYNNIPSNSFRIPQFASQSVMYEQLLNS